MSTQPRIPGQIPQALEELRALLGQLRDSKGKPQKGVTSAVKEYWSRLVATVFADQNGAIEPLLQDLASLPPAVVAAGIAFAWENMDEARRGTYRRWLDS